MDKITELLDRILLLLAMALHLRLQLMGHQLIMNWKLETIKVLRKVTILSQAWAVQLMKTQGILLPMVMVQKPKALVR